MTLFQLFKTFLCWKNFRFTGSCRDGAGKPCVPFVQFPQAAKMYMATVRYQNQETGVTTMCVCSSASSDHVCASRSHHCSQEAELFLGKDLPRDTPWFVTPAPLLPLLPNPSNHYLLTLSLILSFWGCCINEILFHFKSRWPFEIDFFPHIANCPWDRFQLLCVSVICLYYWVVICDKDVLWSVWPFTCCRRVWLFPIFEY